MSILNLIDSTDNTFFDSIQFDSSYSYWCSKNELQKLILSNDNLKYLPCIPYEEIDYNELIGNDVLIFLKTPKIFYGIVRVKSVLVNKTNKYFSTDNYLTINNISNNNINNELIYSNDELYSNLLNKYCVVGISSLFFIEFEYISIFEFEIDIRIYNKFKFNNVLIEKFEYPKNIFITNIKKTNYKYFDNFLFEYIRYLKSQSQIQFPNPNPNPNPNPDIKNNLEITNNNINNQNLFHFKIPILWNGCKDIIKKFKKQDLNKKLILDHWENCVSCEIINNNMNKLELKNKKIVINNIIGKENHHMINKIITDYKNISSFVFDNNSISNIKLEKDKINILYCFELVSIYKNCFFVLEN